MCGAPVDLTGPPVMTLPKHLCDIREPHPVHCHMHIRQTWASTLTRPNEPSTRGELRRRAEEPCFHERRARYVPQVYSPDRVLAFATPGERHRSTSALLDIARKIVKLVVG
jgi:hypothetical protein